MCSPVIGFASDAAKIAKTDLSKKSTADSRELLLHHSRYPPQLFGLSSTEDPLLKSLSFIAHATSLKYVSGLAWSN